MVTLYSTGCPRCKILEQKLQQKNIDFNIESDMQTIIDMGFRAAPILKVDENFYDFGGAIKWVNSYEN